MQKQYFALLVLVFLTQISLAQTKPVVVLSGGVPNEQIRARMQENVATVLDVVSRYTRDAQPFKLPDIFEYNPDRKEGVRQLKQLADSTDMRFDQRSLESEIVNLVDGSLEIRKIFVNVKDSTLRKEQELVLTTDKFGYPTGARFAMVEHQYQEIIGNSESLEDEFRRKQLISYLEQFRTAYNRKDADFLEQQFSDNALIITGSKVQVAPGVAPPTMKPGEESPEQFKLTRQSKQQYIANLRNKIFKLNAFVDVQFEDIKVYQHPDHKAVYGINLLQKWSTNRYSDVGYLFLMIDYTDEMKPLIYVRAWQPESMIQAGNKIIDIDAFEIIK